VQASATAVAMNPPFSGTAFLHTGIITEADWSAYTSMTYAGQASRWVFDRRVNQWLFQPMHLFNASFADGLASEVQVNPEFGSQAAAAIEAEKYALVVGRLPTSMRTDVQSITIHKGLMPFGGGNNNLLIHTDQAIQYGSYLEEILFHEAGHTSFDAAHANSPGWLSAQQNDPTFISTYARDNPTREDIAESILPWFALRYTNVLFPFQIDAINAAIPNRLAYFDALPFQLNQPPLVDSGDFNGDGVIDAADYTVWRNAFGATGLEPFAPGDGNGDGQVDIEDYAIWKMQYGTSSVASATQSATSLPEPNSFALLGLAAAILASALTRNSNR
jgi:hypothetical protein